MIVPGLSGWKACSRRRFRFAWEQTARGFLHLNLTNNSIAAQADSGRRARLPQDHVNRVVRQSGTSFYWAMRILPAERRKAMYAIYAFCREVDDIADKPGEGADKLQALSGWREEIDRLYAGRPQRPTSKALLEAVERFDLPRQEFLAVIDGMQIDAAPVVRMRRVEDLLDYCRKVAGAVGMLSIRAFGMPQWPGPQIAQSLGNALQLTNILRDIKSDAAIHRLYVPTDMLEKHGISAPSLSGILTHPGFAGACIDLAKLARSYYVEAEEMLAELRHRLMRPAAVMMHIYRETLHSLESRGWQKIADPSSIRRRRMLWLALRHGLL